MFYINVKESLAMQIINCPFMLVNGLKIIQLQHKNNSGSLT